MHGPGHSEARAGATSCEPLWSSQTSFESQRSAGSEHNQTHVFDSGGAWPPFPLGNSKNIFCHTSDINGHRVAGTSPKSTKRHPIIPHTNHTTNLCLPGTCHNASRLEHSILAATRNFLAQTGAGQIARRAPRWEAVAKNRLRRRTWLIRRGPVRLRPQDRLLRQVLGHFLCG